MSTIHELLAAHLDALGLTHEVDRASGEVDVDVPGPHDTTIHVTALVDEAAHRVVIRAAHPNRIDPIDAPLLTDYVRLANLDEPVGSLELELGGSPSVRFTTTVEFSDAEPSADLIARAFDLAVDGVVRHAPGIASVLHGLSIDLALPAPPA
jgi:hypothetical protein